MSRVRAPSHHLTVAAVDLHRARQHSGPIGADERCQAFLDSMDAAVGDDHHLLYDPRDPFYILHQVVLEIEGDLELLAATARPPVYDPGFVVEQPKQSRIAAETRRRLKEVADRETDCDWLSQVTQRSESGVYVVEPDSDVEDVDESIDPVGVDEHLDGLCDSMHVMNVLSPHGTCRPMLATSTS